MSEQNAKIAIAFYEELINEFDPESAFRTIRRRNLYTTYSSNRGRPGGCHQVYLLASQHLPRLSHGDQASVFRWRHGDPSLPLGA